MLNETLKQTLLVTRNGSIDEEWLHELIATERREVISAAGRQAVELATRPLRNFSLNMLDLLSH